MTAPVLPRRGFLSGLATLPLIGGGVTLIGRSSAVPIPLVDVAAAPILSSPQERARYAWEALASAMREITADAHGWYFLGGERTVDVGRMKQRKLWCRPQAIHCLPMFPDNPEHKGLVDIATEIEL